MEESFRRDEQESDSRRYSNEFDERSRDIEFNREKKNNDNRSIEDMLQESDERTAGLDRNSEKDHAKINTAKIMKLFGIDAYDRTRKKILKKKQSRIDQLEQKSERLENSIYNNKDGLVVQKQELKKYIGDTYYTIEIGEKALVELDNESRSIEDKILEADKAEDFEAISILREEKEAIDNNIDMKRVRLDRLYDDLEDEVHNLESIDNRIAEQTHVLTKEKESLRQSKKEMSDYRRVIDDNQEAGSYLQHYKSINDNNNTAKELRSINESSEKINYFVKEKIIRDIEKETIPGKEISSIGERQKRDILDSRQESNNKIERARDIYRNAMRR